MRVLNPLTFVFFGITRFVLWVSWGLYRAFGGILRVLWIPAKAALYVMGAAVGLGVVVGLVVLAVNGGHFHAAHNDGIPVRVFGK